MPRRTHAPSRWLAGLSLAALVGGAAAGCSSDLDTTRTPRPATTTLGEDMFSVLCDRVGASVFAEDLEGRSYRGVCRKTADGWASNTVDTSVLPRPSASGATARRLAVAKVEAMARRRDDLVSALDATFADVDIDDPRSPGDKVRLHDALLELARRITPLYESSPYATDDRPAQPLLPATTRSLAATLAAFSESDPARAALARIAGRQGYRPAPASLGALRALLAYPRLRRFSQIMLDRVGPGGPLEGKLQHLMRVAQQELRTLAPDPKQPPISVDEASVQPSRPRGKLELLSALLLSQDAAFSRTKLVEPHPVAARDIRGFVLPAGAPSKPPAPFVDADGDGFADVDLLGRFVGKGGEPVGAPPPFARPWLTFDEGAFSFDPATGRARTAKGAPLYSYIDTPKTLLASLAVDLEPLVAPQKKSGPSTLMKALEGARVLYGDRAADERAYGPTSARVVVPYTSFVAETSPLLDLTHAFGVLLGAPESDDYLGAIADLHEKHPEKTGRALALAWATWSESKSPAHAQAVLADTSTFWDDMAAWLAKAARVGPDRHTGPKTGAAPLGLLPELTLAMGSPDAVKYLPEAFGGPFTHVDRLSYQPSNVNGAPLDLTIGSPITPQKSFSVAVDRSKPDVGDNRSAFQRFARIISAANHVNACNRPKSLVKSTLNVCGIDLPLVYPIAGDIDECGLFEIRDLGVFFIDSVLPFDHPRRARLEIKDDVLQGLLQVVDKLVPSSCGDFDIDTILQNSTGLNGLTTTPSPQALTRLVFFGARAIDDAGNPKYAFPPDQLDPFLDGQNKGLAQFIENTLDLVGTSACPQNAKGVNVCDDWADTMRGVEPGTFFMAETPWLAAHPPSCKARCDALPAASDAEKHARAVCLGECAGPSSGFYEGIRPVLTAFANYAYDPDPGELCPKDKAGRCVGEQLFIDLVAILDRHWGGKSSGLHRYEELLAWVFSSQSDLFGVAADLGPALRDQGYVSPRVAGGKPRSGLEVTRSLVGYLFDPAVAKAAGVADRKGSTKGTRNDGTPKAHVTPHDLLARALRGIDARFEGKAPQKARWREARSELVDAFVLADAGGWVNPGVERALPSLARLVREQVNANCPGREAGAGCAWATEQLPAKLADVLSGPLFAAIDDLNDALRADDEARVELEQLLVYLLSSTPDDGALDLTLTSLADLLQSLADDGNLAPPLNAASSAIAPGMVEGAATDDAGLVHVLLSLLKVMLDERRDLPDDEAAAAEYDRYHALDHVLRNLATPTTPGGLAPLDTLLDVVADVHRIDAGSLDPLGPDDYRAVTEGVRAFLVDDLRGMEQFYTIVRRRNER